MSQPQIKNFLTYSFDSGNKQDTTFHHWGQQIEGAEKIFETFIRPGKVVCDPFLGGGTFGVVALQQDHSFIGNDIDAETLEVAKGRLYTEGLENGG